MTLTLTAELPPEVVQAVSDGERGYVDVALGDVELREEGALFSVTRRVVGMHELGTKARGDLPGPAIRVYLAREKEDTDGGSNDA